MKHWDVFSNYRFYLRGIAIPNCQRFFEYEVAFFSKDNSEMFGEAAIMRIRLFFNAAESLNNAIDYVAHSFPDEVKSFELVNKASDFPKRASQVPGELASLREIVNAYKHCVRGFNEGRDGPVSKPNARHLLGPTLSFDFENQDYYVGPSIPQREHVNILHAAYHFWSEALKSDAFPFADQLADQ
ncbi:hypothetical protein ACM26W_01250 [Halomonas sp. HK25]|uniref:hypothetical protein n=1 Tax=Halomonas sp. HK25 TaxID=3394321 RepID=UPI0039FC5935